MSLRDEALREMASAIEATFDGPPTDWTPEAEAALDALLDYLTEHAVEWEKETGPAFVAGTQIYGLAAKRLLQTLAGETDE